MRPDVGAELLIALVVRPFAEQVEVEIGQDRAEAVGIFEVPGVAVVPFDLQAIGEGLEVVGQDDLEQAIGMDPMERDLRAISGVFRGDDPRPFRLGQEGTDGPRGLPPQLDLVRAQDRERVPEVGVDQVVDDFLGDGRGDLWGGGHCRRLARSVHRRRTPRTLLTLAMPTMGRNRHALEELASSIPRGAEIGLPSRCSRGDVTLGMSPICLRVFRPHREGVRRMSTVLLVDDSPSDRALFRMILGRAGFSVHELSRGLDAVAKAREIRPHVVVLDVNLPDTDGHAVCRAIRADPVCSGLPVLMLTVKGHDDDVLAGLEAGADDYLAKDEAGEIILARVRRLVQFRKLATISVLNEQLAQVGRLVAGIVHEIRAPLTVIRGNAELIALELDGDSPATAWVEPILRSVKTLQVRLDHLMAAVRTGPSDPAPLDVLPLLREAVSLFLKGTDPRRGKVARGPPGR